jgi:O-antigen/teichoic acid export membrane protein
MLKVGILLTSVANLLPQMLYPYVAKAWASSDWRLCRRYYLLGVLGAVGVYIILATPIFLLREPLFTHWLGKGKYLGTAILGAFLVYQLIYVHQCAQASPVFASNGNAFIVPSIVSGILTPIMVIFLSRWFGLVGIPLGMIVGILPCSFMVIRTSWRSIMRNRFSPELHLMRY